MKKNLFLTLGFLAFGAVSSQGQVITGFGTSELNPFNTAADLAFSTWSPSSVTLTSTTLTVTNVQNTGALDIYADPLATPVPISAASQNFLTLQGSLNGTGTNFSIGSFRIYLYDSSFDSLAYNFNYTSFGSSVTSVTSGLDLADSSGPFNGTVVGYELDGSGTPSDTFSFTFDQLTAAPEPSTYAMLGFGMFMLYFVYRRKVRQA